MGRTNPTYRDTLRVLEDDWEDYRRALRQEDQQRFDHLFEYAHQHADAAGNLTHRNPIIPTLFSIILAQEAQLDDLEDRVDAIESDGPADSTTEDT